MSDEKNITVAEGSEGLPRHIAVIMDGNGRWAQQRGLPRTKGHAAGVESFRRCAHYCRALGVQYLTVYAFSTENWKRSKEEVTGIMQLLETYLHEAMTIMDEERTRIEFFGDMSMLSAPLRLLCEQVRKRSARYTEAQVNVCLNYGGRDEIVRAAKRWAADGCPELNEDLFGSYLYSAGVPDPDLLIRPGGEKRISNYLLWQLAYTEFYFSDVLWPDFDEAEIDKALAAYRARNRRYGGVTEAKS